MQRAEIQEALGGQESSGQMSQVLHGKRQSSGFQSKDPLVIYQESRPCSNAACLCDHQKADLSGRCAMRGLQQSLWETVRPILTGRHLLKPMFHTPAYSQVCLSVREDAYGLPDLTASSQFTSVLFLFFVFY